MKYLLPNICWFQGRGSKPDEDEGSISPLIIGMCLLVLLIASVTLAVTGAHVQTHRLEDLADAQTISVARSIQHDVSGTGNVGEHAQAQQLAAAYLQESGARSEFTNLQIESLEVRDDRTLHITLRARIHPPLISAVVPDGFEVRAHARARIHQTQIESEGL